MEDQFEVLGPDGTPRQLRISVSDRERRRYIEGLSAIAKACQMASDGFENNNDTQALAGSVGLLVMSQQLGGELREVIDEAMENAARDFAQQLAGPIDIDPDTVEIPDTVEGLLAEVEEDTGE